MNSSIRGSLPAALPLVLFLAGCTPTDEPWVEGYAVLEREVEGVETTYQRAFPAGTMDVVAFEIGNRIGRNLRVPEPAEHFEPEDPIFVVVVTEGGEPGAMLEVRWSTMDGEVLHRESTRVGAGRGYTEFGAPRARDWPLGRYRVELLLEGEEAGRLGFEIVEDVTDVTTEPDSGA